MTLRGTALKGSTDLSGRFVIRPIPPGTYALEARRIGYEPLVFESIPIDGDTTVTLALEIFSGRPLHLDWTSSDGCNRLEFLPRAAASVR